MNFEAQQVAATDRLAVATLAAAMVQVRGDASPKGVQEALSDARNLLLPERSAGTYQAWQQKHGLK